MIASCNKRFSHVLTLFPVISSLLGALLLAGCATHSPPLPSGPPRPAGLFPTNGLITQRAILTARGKEYPLNGYLAINEAHEMRLIVSAMLGSVLADVLVKQDGRIFVMRSSGMFRASWIRRYMAADLQCIFGEPPPLDCPVTMPDPGHFIVQRRWYKLELRVVDARPGPQPAIMFDETNKP
jgi:hypothetical protein